MSLATRLAALAVAVAEELKARPTAAHPGLAKAWVCFGAPYGHTVLHASHHVGGVRRFGRGRFRIRFAPSLPDADFCWTANAQAAGAVPLRVGLALKTPHHLDLICTDADGLATDPHDFNLTVFR